MSTEVEAIQSKGWLYQIRLQLTPSLAKEIRSDKESDATRQLQDMLSAYDASLLCQFDAFANFCREAERNGEHDLPLYKWTKATIEDEAKKAKYLKIFTIYVNDEQLYSKRIADSLEKDLKVLASNSGIEKISKYDSNPENNPQTPAKYRN